MDQAAFGKVTKHNKQPKLLNIVECYNDNAYRLRLKIKHVSASSQSLRFILYLKMNSSFITPRPVLLSLAFKRFITLGAKLDLMMLFCLYVSVYN